MKRKIFTLCAALIVGASTLLASETAVDGIYYNFDDANLTATVTYRGSSYDEYTGDVVIPATVTYGGKTYSVTSIGGWAFSGCSGLTSITIPNSVTSIDYDAFSGCSGLTKTNYMGDIAGWCGITFEGWGTNPTTQSHNLYINGVEVKDLVIPDGVTSIGAYAFSGCSGLTSITIPNSVTSIEHGAFADCSGLTSVTIPNSVTSIGSYAFYGCNGLTSITIPNSVTSIGGEAFAGTAWLENQPDGVIYINQLLYTYKGEMPANTSIVVRDGTTKICDVAFSGCSGLTSITIPNSVTSIGSYAFEGCSSLTSVVWNAKNCADFEYDIYAPFYNIASQITSFTFGEEVEHIPAYLCYGMENLTSVTIPNSVTGIGDDAFSGCSGLTSVVWNAQNCANFSSYYYAPFYDIASQITSFTFGEEVEHIPAYLCYGMENLTSVTIPNSVTSIGEEAFWGCSGLTSVVWNAKNCVIVVDDAPLIPIHYLPFYDIASQITSFTFGDAVEHIPAYLCYGMENLTSVTIPNSVDSIGEYAFRGCSGLTSVTIPNSVTSIGEGAFCGCSGLTSVTIPNSVTSIGDEAFYGCSGLTSVTIGNSVESIGDYAFCACSGLTSVAIPNSVTSIGHATFYECSGLTSVTIPNSVTSIGDYAFYECSGLTSVTIGNSVEIIGGEAFAECSELKTVVIGNAVTNIGDGAFYGCNRLLYFTCYAEEPPFVGTDPFSTYNAYLKVPCSGLDAYKMYDVWRNFNNISCIGSDEVQVTEFNVTPSVNDAQFTWPAEPNAATYELVISKDGVVFCTLTFNANGQLMGIAFAPGVNGPAAAPTTSGFQFTVTGLDEASHYAYTFDAKDADGGVIQHYAGEFNTDGYVGLEQIELANIYTQDGRIVCEGEFRIYDLLGRDVTRLNGSLCGVYVVKSGNAAVKVVVK